MAYFPFDSTSACSSATDGEACRPSVSASDAFNTIATNYHRTITGLDLGSEEDTSSAVAVGAAGSVAGHRC